MLCEQAFDIEQELPGAQQGCADAAQCRNHLPAAPRGDGPRGGACPKIQAPGRVGMRALSSCSDLLWWLTLLSRHVIDCRAVAEKSDKEVSSEISAIIRQARSK